MALARGHAVTDWMCQYRSWPEKNHTFLCVLVLCLSYSRHVRVAQKEHFHIQKVAAELVTSDLFANEVPLKEYCSKIPPY